MPDLAQNHFDSTLPQKHFLRKDEVAKLLQLSSATIRKLVENGQLSGVEFSSGEGLRKRTLILRQGVVLFLLKSKTYEIEDYLSDILRVISLLSAAELAVIREQLPRLTAQAVAREPGKQ